MIPKPLQLAQSFIQQAVCPGDTVIDATLGNGHDALFLAKLVGEHGLLIGLDLQELAVENSRQRLLDAGITWFQLHQSNHAQLSSLVPPDCKAAAIMFNLGYLPHADKSIITTLDSTLLALEGAMQQLKPRGIITIMCYPGHDGGQQESHGVSQRVSSLPRSEWRVFEYKMLNASSPPYLVVLERV